VNSSGMTVLVSGLQITFRVSVMRYSNRAISIVL